jgi:hypothetical protein
MGQIKRPLASHGWPAPPPLPPPLPPPYLGLCAHGVGLSVGMVPFET